MLNSIHTLLELKLTLIMYSLFMHTKDEILVVLNYQVDEIIVLNRN